MSEYFALLCSKLCHFTFILRLIFGVYYISKQNVMKLSFCEIMCTNTVQLFKAFYMLKVACCSKLFHT